MEEKNLGFYMVARVAGKPVGSMMITYAYDWNRHQQEWWFQSVFVEKEYRGNGIFKKMFSIIE